MPEEISKQTIPSVLFVDDEVDFAEAMSTLLGAEGFEVSVAHSGAEALNTYSKGKFDLIVTDLKMPVMDGIELVRNIRRQNPTQPIVIVTGFPGQLTPWNRRFNDKDEDLVELGSLNYLVKPFQPKRLVEVVRGAIEKQKARLARAKRTPPLSVAVAEQSGLSWVSKVAQKTLEESADAIDGLMASGIADTSGRILAEINPASIPQNLYCGRFAIVMAILRETARDMGNGKVVETIVESDSHWSVAHFIGQSNYYLCVVASRQTTLGNLRTLVRKLAERFEKVI